MTRRKTSERGGLHTDARRTVALGTGLSNAEEPWRAHWPGDAKSILVVDDARTFAAFDAAYARTADAAISLLRDDWDEVWLDHDLAVGETIRPVVAWILECIDLGDKP